MSGKIWGSTLSRKAPMKRSELKRGGMTPWAKRRAEKAEKAEKAYKPIKKISKSKRNALKNKYAPVRRLFLQTFTLCGICMARGLQPNQSTEVHHSRGRNGALLWDDRFFVASCRACREWPHENPHDARKLGLICHPSEWNSVPRDEYGNKTGK